MGTTDTLKVTTGLPLLAAFAITPLDHKKLLNVTLPNRESGFSFLVRNCVAQDDRFRNAFDVLEKAIAARAFPACSLSVTFHGELVAHKALGRFTYDPTSPEVTTASLFDVASLTKVVATTAMAMILYERGLLDLEAPVTAIVPEFAGQFAGQVADNDPRRREVTVRMLLAHSSGLPAYESFFCAPGLAKTCCKPPSPRHSPLLPARASNTATSASSFWAAILERLADESLDVFCQREIFGPLGMAHTTFKPSPALKIPSRLPRTIGASAIASSKARCRTKTRASLAALPARRAVLYRRRFGHFRPHHAQRRPSHTAPGYSRTFFAPRIRARRHFPSAGLGHSLGLSQSGKYFSNVPSDISVTPVHLCGSTRSGNFRSLCLPIAPGLTAANQAIKQVRPAFHDAVVEALGKTD
jgi:hypothetical protein